HRRQTRQPPRRRLNLVQRRPNRSKRRRRPVRDEVDGSNKGSRDNRGGRAMIELGWSGVLRSCRQSACALVVLAMTGGMANAHGPESVADIAAKLSPSVVNISTSQKVAGGQAPVPMPELPPGSPFRDFF